MPDPPHHPTLSYAAPPVLDASTLVIRPKPGGGCASTAALSLIACVIVSFAWSSSREHGLCFVTGILLVTALVIVDRYLAIRHSSGPGGLVLTQTSFYFGIGDILWRDIADAQVVDHGEQTFLVLRLVDPAAVEQPATLWNRPTFDRPPEAADHDVIVPITGWELPPDAILKEIRKRIHRPPSTV